MTTPPDDTEGTCPDDPIAAIYAAGPSIRDAAEGAHAMAVKQLRTITFVCNGIRIPVHPTDTVEQIVDRYNDLLTGEITPDA